MKSTILLTVITLLLHNNAIAQTTVSLDTLVGEKGIFARFTPKAIGATDKLSFNLKMSFKQTDAQGDVSTGVIYFNTRLGYCAMAKGDNFVFDVNSKHFHLMLFTHDNTSMVLQCSRGGEKTLIAMPFAAPATNRNATVQRSAKAPKSLTASNIKVYPYTLGTARDSSACYVSDGAIKSTSQLKNLLCYAGIGFMQFGSKTVMCLAVDFGSHATEVVDISTVNEVVDLAQFKNDSSTMPAGMMDEIMKKIKKK
jgi:hypothetical protein